MERSLFSWTRSVNLIGTAAYLLGRSAIDAFLGNDTEIKSLREDVVESAVLSKELPVDPAEVCRE